MNIGKAVKEVRNAKRMTQKEMCIKCGFTDNFISLLENGKRGITHPGLQRIADALGVSIDFILYLSLDMKKAKKDCKKVFGYEGYFELRNALN